MSRTEWSKISSEELEATDWNIISRRKIDLFCLRVFFINCIQTNRKVCNRIDLTNEVYEYFVSDLFIWISSIDYIPTPLTKRLSGVHNIFLSNVVLFRLWNLLYKHFWKSALRKRNNIIVDETRSMVLICNCNCLKTSENRAKIFTILLLLAINSLSS